MIGNFSVDALSVHLVLSLGVIGGNPSFWGWMRVFFLCNFLRKYKFVVIE